MLSLGVKNQTWFGSRLTYHAPRHFSRSWEYSGELLPPWSFHPERADRQNIQHKRAHTPSQNQNAVLQIKCSKAALGRLSVQSGLVSALNISLQYCREPSYSLPLIYCEVFTSKMTNTVYVLDVECIKYYIQKVFQIRKNNLSQKYFSKVIYFFPVSYCA